MDKIGTESICLFGEMEIDPTLPHKQMYEKAKDIAEQCGYLVKQAMIGGVKLITIYDNDSTRYFRLEYGEPETDEEQSHVWYNLTKIEEWRRGRVWVT